MKSLKKNASIVVAVLGLALPGYALDIVNDTWADANRTSSGPDGSGIDSQWFSSSAANLTVPAAGDLRAVIPAGSHFMTTYFPSASSPYGPAPVTLANVGDALRVTWVYTMTGLNATNANQNLVLAVANTPGTHLAADGSPSQQVYAGYAMFMNIAPAFGNANPFAIREWTNAAAGNLLGTSANWGPTLANDGALGNAGYAGSTTYTYQMTLTLNASSGLDILSTMTGGTLNGVGGLTNSITDATPNSLSFDTFAIRPGTSSATAGQFDTSLFRVEFLPVPEPSTIALAGMAVLGLVACYRRMRR